MHGQARVEGHASEACDGVPHKLPYLKWNPQWWAIKIFDGFSAHLDDLGSLQHCWENLIVSIREEGNSLSINQ